MRYDVLSRYRTELMGAAIGWVMLFHSFDLDLGHWAVNWLRAAGFGGVDIFIVLSSMGLVMSLARREQDYSSFMARRASRILPAYYIVMVPYTIFFILYYKTGWSGLIWNCLLLYYWVRPAAAFNWYIAGSMSFYAVTPLCYRRLRRSRHREVLTAAAILIASLANTLLTREGYWYAMDVAFRVPLFFLGLLMGFYVVEERRLGAKDLLFWCLWAGAGAAYLLARHYFHLEEYLPLCVLFLFSTVPSCLVLCWCFERLPLGWLRPFLRLLGTYSLEIYLLNVSLFSEVALLRKLVSFGPSNRLYFLLSYAANILLAVLLHRAVEGLRNIWTRRKDASLAAV